MNNNTLDQRGIGHLIFLVAVPVILLIGLVGYKATHHDTHVSSNITGYTGVSPSSGGPGYKPNTGPDLGNPDSLDPVTKGKASSNGKCEGKGSTKMTYAPMKASDIGTIAPMGEYGGSHVTPIDHEYYYGIDQNSAKDAYPVYATMDGYLTSLGKADTPTGTNWNVTLAHSCTFMIYYNLMTSIAPNIMKQVPSNWQMMGGTIKVPIKAGQIMGYVGGQSLDFELADTTFTNPKLLYHTAYNNTEPFKINVVHPLDFFTDSVKNEILPKYLRTAEPRDGNYAYDIDGTATGNWFKVGTNGYAGGDLPTGGPSSTTLGHLALAYDGFDPTALVVSTGNYQNGVGKVLVVNDTSTDWTKITPASGAVKVQLAEGSIQKPGGGVWSGGYVSGGLKYVPTVNQATALIQLTAKQELKFEMFIGKTPAQVTAFDSNAVMYDRGQDAHMLKSNTASPSVNTKQ